MFNKISYQDVKIIIQQEYITEFSITIWLFIFSFFNNPKVYYSVEL